MKKNEKKTVKPAKVPAKKAAKSTTKPLFRDVKALVKAVLNGEKPRGLKVVVGDENISFLYGKNANVTGKGAALLDILGAIGIKVS